MVSGYDLKPMACAVATAVRKVQAYQRNYWFRFVAIWHAVAAVVRVVNSELSQLWFDVSSSGRSQSYPPICQGRLRWLFSYRGVWQTGIIYQMQKALVNEIEVRFCNRKIYVTNGAAAPTKLQVSELQDGTLRYHSGFFERFCNRLV